MEEIILCAGDSLDVAVVKLLKAKDEGKHAFCDFNDVKLYSDNVTLDSAYIEVCGCTKTEWEEKLKKSVEESKKRMEEKRENTIENISNLIERGKALIYPFRHEEWAKLVEADVNGDYSGLITTDALEIMTAIEEEKTIEELLEIFDKQDHSGWTASLTRNVIMTYSKNGYPFYKATKYGKWTQEEFETILKLMQENEEHSKELPFDCSEAKSREEVIAKQKRLARSQNQEQL